MANRIGKTGKKTPSRPKPPSSSNNTPSSKSPTGRIGKTGANTPTRNGKPNPSQDSSPDLYTSSQKRNFGDPPKPTISQHITGTVEDRTSKEILATIAPDAKIITEGKDKTHIFHTNIKHGRPYTTITEIIHTKGMDIRSSLEQLNREAVLAKKYKDEHGFAHPTFREQIEAKNKATEEHKAKWGTVGHQGTATQTDVAQALLTSNNQHYGTDTRNLEEYLTERDYDISAIIAGEQTLPDDIFKPVKQTEYREISKEITQKLDKISQTSNKNDQAILKEEIQILQEKQKQIDETTIRDITDHNITSPTTAPAIQVSRNYLIPIIFIAIAGLIAIYLIRRKK